MIVVIGDYIGNFPDFVGGVAHGNTQPRSLQHGAVIAGIAHRHRLVTRKSQIVRQRQQAAALRNAGGVDVHIAGQAGSPAAPR